MQNNLKYINLSWAVVGICEGSHLPLSKFIPDIDKNEAAAVEHYVIGYLAFWHIAFVDEKLLQPDNASSPIEMTELGMVNEVNPVQAWRACTPIVVTELGIVTEVKVLQQ